MRCKACSTVWLVSGPGATPLPDHAKAAALASPPKDKTEGPKLVLPATTSEDSFARRARTGAEREKRDLFAETDEPDGRVKETILPPPSFGFNGGVGARNENSVLFRVDQLAPASIPPAGRFKTPEPSPVAARAPESDNEGVIDLKALSSAPPALRPVGLPVAPLFSEPPGVSYDTDDSAQHPAQKGTKKKKLGWVGIAAAAAAFLVVAGFGVSFAFKGETPVKHDAPVVAAPPPPAATPVPAKTADPPPAASSASTSTDDKSDETSAKGKKGKKGKGKGKGKGSASGPITDKTPPPTKPAVKPADPCGCKGDFNCILACTAKGGK